MVINLVILYIHNNEKALRAVLDKVNDNTWNDEAVADWVKDEKVDCIWYCDTYKSYFSGNKVTHNSKHIWKTFDEVMNDE